MKTTKILIIMIALIQLGNVIGCQKSAEPTSSSDARTPAGEIVIDTFVVSISPDSVSWSFVFHFANRPGNRSDFEIDVGNRFVAGRYYTYPASPLPLDHVFSHSGSDSLRAGVTAGDSVSCEVYLAGHFYDPESQSYPTDARFTRRFTKRFPVLLSTP